MPVERSALHLAVVAMHSCPLALPGTRDAGGMNVYIRETARALSRNGVAVDIFTRLHEGATRRVVRLARRARVVHLPAGPETADKQSLPNWLGAFADEALRFVHGGRLRYDAVISQYWLSGLAAIQLAEAWHTPHIAGFHTLAMPKMGAFPEEREARSRIAGERSVAAHADRLLWTSEHERDVLENDYAADPRRFSFAPPGVNPSRFRPRDRSACRRQLGIPNDSPLLLFVGRITPLKGIEVLLETLALSGQRANASLLVVGGTPGSADSSGLMRLARRLGVADRVRFAGSIPHRRLPWYYGAADLCIVPSFYESYGLVALEAAACGVPVVASRVGGMATAVRHGSTGILVAPGSPIELRDAILTLLEDEAFRAAAGAAGFRMSRGLTWDRTATCVLDALEQTAIYN